ALTADLELSRRLRDVAAGLFERAQDELALDPLGLGADDLLERGGAGSSHRLLGGHGREGRRARRRRQLWRQIVPGDARPFTEQNGPLEHVLELANVAGPVIADQAIERVSLDPLDRLFETVVELGDEVLDQRGDVLAPFAQR